jgi:EamA-like transporter family.
MRKCHGKTKTYDLFSNRSQMVKFLFLITLQGLVNAAAQILLKIGLTRITVFEWKWNYIKLLIKNIPLMGSLFLMLFSTCFWFYIIKNFKFSIAYPLSTVTYIFGMFGAVFFLNEQLNPLKYIGVALIIAGAFILLK